MSTGHTVTSTTRSISRARNVYQTINVSDDSRAVVGNVENLLDEGQRQAQARTGDWTSRFKRELYAEHIRHALSTTPFCVPLHLAPLLLKDFQDVLAMTFSLLQCQNQSNTHSAELKRRVDRDNLQLRVRQSVFGRCLLQLLKSSRVFDAATAACMSRDETHEAWSGSYQFANYVRDWSASNPLEPERILEAISTELENIGGIYKTCVALYREPATNGNVAKLLRSQDLHASLASLDASIISFQNLVPFTPPSREPTRRRPDADGSKQAISLCGKVREGASHLYEAFQTSCWQHQSHQMSLGIVTGNSVDGRLTFRAFFGATPTVDSDRQPPRHRFPPSLASSGFSRAYSSNFLYGLTIESQLLDERESSVHIRRPSDEGILGRKRQRSRMSPDPIVRRSAASSSTSTAGNHFNVGDRPTTLFSTASLEENIKQPDELPNLSLNSSMCKVIECKISQTATQLSGHSLGYFDRPNNNITYLLYLNAERMPLPHHADECFPKCPTARVTCLLCFMKKHSSSYEVSTYDIARIARKLALAVLQYHDTPWLQNLGHADQISFVPMEPDEIEGFYLNTSFPRAASRDIVQSRTVIRNQALFSYGALLLELAYAKSLAQLQELEDIDLHYKHNTIYYTAERLQRGVSRIMGTKYSEIVRQCIKCDFGCGEDLSTPELQRKFYESVISKLETLEAELKQLES